MKAGIIGTRAVGKTTVFQALTGLAPIEGSADSRNRGRPGQIKVPDRRLDFIDQTYNSKKKVHVELTVVDFAPNLKEQKADTALDASLLPLIRDLDALLLVIPEFSGNRAEPLQAIKHLESELMFADFDQAHRRIEKLKKEKGDNEIERAALEKCVKHLEAEAPLRTLDLTPQEIQKLSAFCFLSQKPALVVINCDMEQAASKLDPQLVSFLHERRLEVLLLAAAFEAELWQLDAPAQQELLKEAGLEAPARDRLIAALHRHLGLITFFTGGESEAHAWSLNQGATALDAAGRIHSDLARGFIRAEVMSFADFERLGSESKVKAAGRLRLEGRDYLMNDGDIIVVRFKV